MGVLKRGPADCCYTVLQRRAVEEKIISVACTQMGAGDAIDFLNAAFLFVLQDKIIQDLGISRIRLKGAEVNPIHNRSIEPTSELRRPKTVGKP